jgi:hypothetical protein
MAEYPPANRVRLYAFSNKVAKSFPQDVVNSRMRVCFVGIEVVVPDFDINAEVSHSSGELKSRHDHAPIGTMFFIWKISILSGII